jgi:hydrogenase nickel incorporation protein HypB
VDAGTDTLFVKQLKYLIPVMFRQADLVLITKTDLLPYFKYDVEAEKAEARRIKPNVDILEVNVNDIDSVKAVAEWIEFKRKMRG